MELFGEGDAGDWRIIIISVLLAAAGSLGTFVATQLWKLRGERKAERVEAEKSILEHKQNYIDRLESEQEGCRAEVRELTELAARRGVLVATLRGHVRYLQRVMDANRISYEAWQEPAEDESGFCAGVAGNKTSTEHKPLPPEQHKGS